MRTLLAVLCLLLAPTLGQAEIVLHGPTGPTVINRLIPILVGGVADGTWGSAVQRHFPREGTSQWNVFNSQHQPLIFFEAGLPGDYILWVVAQPEEGGIGYAEIQIEVTGTPQPPGPDPIPGPDVVEPTPELRCLVQSITSIMQGEDKDGAKIAHFYLAFADLVARDTSVITSTRVIRSANVKAGGLMFQQTGMKDKHAGLGEAIDEALETHLGLEDVALDSRKRKQAVDVLNAIAWACAPKGGA